MSTHSPETLGLVLRHIEMFRRSEVSIREIERAIWDAACVVSSPDERAMRGALQRASAELDEIQFTIEEDRVRGEALRILDVLAARVKESLGSH